MAISNYLRTTGGLEFDFTVGTNAITVATVTTGGSGYLIGDTITPADITTESVVDTGVLPTDFILTVATVNGTAVATFTITDGGTDGTDGDGQAQIATGTEAGVPSADYLDHDQYEQGGNVQEYTVLDDSVTKSTYTPRERTESLAAGTFVGDPSTDPTAESALRQDDNASTIKVVLKADQAQLAVQKKYIDGGTITVFAEPTTVSADGVVVGNTLRLEDITDEARCVAAGGTWHTDGKGGSTGSNYGYCGDVVAFSATMDKTQCIAQGFIFDNVLDVCVNSDGTDEAVVEAYLNGGAGDSYVGDQKLAICKQQGHYWNGTACVATGSIDFGVTYTTQATCSANGGVWIAGTCYSPEGFGNGQGGDFTETVGSQNNFPFSTKGVK